MGLPAVFVRKECEYSIPKARIEDKDRVAVLKDALSTGQSIVEIVLAIEESGGSIERFIQLWIVMGLPLKLPITLTLS